MMWQDLIFMLGSGLSIVFLAPTLRDASANVPLGTSLPSMGIGFVYGFTFFTLGMTFSAAGAIAAGSMWSLIALFRSPISQQFRTSAALLADDCVRWLDRQRSDAPFADEYVSADRASGADH